MAFAWDRGHPIYWNEVRQEWCYVDSGGRADSQRPCVRCGLAPTLDGHDACLGSIPNVQAACCGHGVYEPYVMFKSGEDVRGFMMNDRIIGAAARAMAKRSNQGKRVTWKELARIALDAANSEAARQMFQGLPSSDVLEAAEQRRRDDEASGSGNHHVL